MKFGGICIEVRCGLSMLNIFGAVKQQNSLSKQSDHLYHVYVSIFAIPSLLVVSSPFCLVFISKKYYFFQERNKINVKPIFINNKSSNAKFHTSYKMISQYSCA